MRAPPPVCLLAGCVLLGGPGSLHGAQSDLYAEQDVLVVEIPVQVTADGQPVLGLEASDFEVLEGRDRIPIVDFEVIDLTASQAGETRELQEAGGSIPSHGRRRFLLLFDLSFSSVASVSKARDSARDLVENGLLPQDLAAVATYSASQGATMVLGFTADRAQLGAAIETLGLARPLDRPSDPLRLMVEDLGDVMDRKFEGDTGEVLGGRPDPDLIEWLKARDLAPLEGQVNRSQLQSQILALTGSLETLADALDRVPGRKQVVFFSEGFDSSVLLGTEDASRTADLAREASEGAFWRVDSEERFGSGAARSGLEEMTGAFRRCDCVIQAVDIGGLRAGGDAAVERLSQSGLGRSGREEGLFVMADQTGGELFRNYNRLSEAMSDLLERTSLTYLLVVQPRAVTLDGSYHPLRVRLKKGPKGARLAHRPGYFAEGSSAGADAVERQLTAADLITSGPTGGDLATTLLTVPFGVGEEEAWVLTALELFGHTLTRRMSSGQLPLELYQYAFDAEGRLRDYQSQAILIDLDRHGEELKRGGFKFLGELRLPAGAYRLRTLVRNPATGEHGVFEELVEVPDFSRPALLPPLFIEPEGTWLVGWSDPRAGVETVSYPLEVNDRRLVPAAEPILPLGAEVPMLLVAHRLGGESPTVDARLEDDEGRTVGTTRAALRDRHAVGSTGMERIWSTVRFADVRPGAYRLVVTLTGSAGRLESATEVLVQ